MIATHTENAFSRLVAIRKEHKAQVAARNLNRKRRAESQPVFTVNRSFRLIAEQELVLDKSVQALKEIGYSCEPISASMVAFKREYESENDTDPSAGPRLLIMSLYRVANSLTEIQLSAAYVASGPLAGVIVSQQVTRNQRRIEMAVMTKNR